jgi:hypothetical protein
VEEPDRLERQRQAVEVVAASASARFVVEHTRVESFKSQIADGKRLDALLGPLETALPAFLAPGTYEVIIQPHAAGSLRLRQLNSVRVAIAKWITETALAARGETLVAFDGRCIPGGGVAPPSNTAGILSRRA